MSDRIRVGIAGASGYAGGELLRLLMGHPEVEVVHLSAQSHAGERLSSVFPHLPDWGILEKTENVISWDDLDVLFCALPAGESSRIVKQLAKPRPMIIDLGPDYRFKDPEEFRRIYRMDHGDPESLSESTYGLVEWNRTEIRKSRVIGSPGCFPTGALLAILPFAKEGIMGEGPVIVDGKSGVSGAGRGLSLETHFPEIAEGMKAYKPLVHRHAPEMERAIATLSEQKNEIVFVPHLIPVNRGLISTVYLPAQSGVSLSVIEEVLTGYAKNNGFVRVLDRIPNSSEVRGTNRIDLHATVGKGMIVVMTAIDNLVKGAAGQGVQAMNLMMGIGEDTGLPKWSNYP